MYNVVRSPNMQLAEIGFGERRMEHYASRRQAWVGRACGQMHDTEEHNHECVKLRLDKSEKNTQR